ncbi:DNA helicase [Actinomadura logoneensis]|uniref:DNA 3'-5' helicase n=1 Tax=Actinomadura logoneensis TaxID=2293572 RepID=A0A372JHD8_9ACTN|nr:UvrD-helicase domain-containing protein [Actinomadura logoneensis]RFU39432.1 DNA helicase [Actinomadura logoneensis]
MATLGIDQDFLRDYAELEPAVQKRVQEVFRKFSEATHAGVHLEKVHNARDPRLQTVRITQFWRGVVLAPDSGDSYTLLKVLPHDAAYSWIQRRRVSVNAATGRIELRDVASIEETLPQLERLGEHDNRRLFDAVNDADLRRLGVDGETLTFARALTDLIQLEASQSFLPPQQYDALIGLALGMSPDEVWAQLAGDLQEQGYDTEDIDAAVTRSPERVVLVHGPDELMAVFADPFALWRIYLHPAQRRVAYGSFGGSAKVGGAPGTGKTVVALHRAAHLAEQGGRVLLTTFTSTLASSLEDSLRLLTSDPEVLDRIDVRHVDQIAYQVVAGQHGRLTILRPAEERATWKRIIKRLGLPFTEGFLAAEWRDVVLGRGVADADAYLAAKRSGRGRALGHLQKAQVWHAVSAFSEELTERNVWTYESMCAEAARLLADAEDKPYDHVIVDEAQDLHPVRWRLLRAAVAEGRDDLFIAGDTHQRIYGNTVSLRGLGIKVAGRSFRLTVNYRTTAEILGWSLNLLSGVRVDDMDEGLEKLSGCRSDVHGSPPTAIGHPTRQRELDQLAEKIGAWISSGVSPEEIGVAARSNKLVDEAVGALDRAGVAAASLARKTPDGAVRAGTMHRMKGLEFRCVAVIGVGVHQIPATGAVTPEEEDKAAHTADLERERCLLFVAATRAREALYVSWHGEPSPFLRPVLT